MAFEKEPVVFCSPNIPTSVLTNSIKWDKIAVRLSWNCLNTMVVSPRPPRQSAATPRLSEAAARPPRPSAAAQVQ
ncbi:hypothetical protein SESBI_33702 [Sesbania bispinosa]|nr:hypothetical protein SESBI_33702 [Sesbania bispinosa]